MDERERYLQWSASGHRWWAKTDEFTLFVSEQAYEIHFKAYLAARGIAWKTLREIMNLAEEKWRCQSEVTDAFHANLAYWMDCHDPGVQVWHPPENRKPVAQGGHPLRWSATGHGWFGETGGGVIIFVPEAVYEAHLQAYYTRRGIACSVCMQIMQPVEEEWWRQCEAAWACWADIDYWLTRDCPGIQLVSLEKVVIRSCVSPCHE